MTKYPRMMARDFVVGQKIRTIHAETEMQSTSGNFFELHSSAAVYMAHYLGDRQFELIAGYWQSIDYEARKEVYRKQCVATALNDERIANLTPN